MPRDAEELYDLTEDPDETTNLAGDAAHLAIRQRFRSLLRAHLIRIRDTGFMPESNLEKISKVQPVQTHCQAEERYPVSRIFDTAFDAAARDRGLPDRFNELAKSKSPVLRYWATMD